MGMAQKLEREYLKGYQDGQQAANEELIEQAKLFGLIQGAQETWDIIEGMIPNLKGIGPKTTQKIMAAIQKHAKEEKTRLKRNVRHGS
jgi:response regulator of citrate/malate metabolism